MSDTQQEMTREDKFFGVSTPVGDTVGTAESDDINDDIKLEIEDDRPPEDQRPPAKKLSSDDDDEELASYSDKVRKRINKLNFEKHEFRRAAEEADRMREEAVNVAHNLHQRMRQTESQVIQGQTSNVARALQSAERAVQNARSGYKMAHDEGDTDKMLVAQETLNAAQLEYRDAVLAKQQMEFQQQRRPQQAQPLQQYRQPRPQAPAPVDPDSPEAKWADKNAWFGDPKHKVMTATAYGIHEELITEEGITPDNPEYYERIDSEMKKRFPEHFDQTDDENTGRGRQPSSTHRSPPNVVASSTRNNGSGRAKTMKITSTQAALAKRLGITPEQYAKELVKEASKNG